MHGKLLKQRVIGLFIILSFFFVFPYETQGVESLGLSVNPQIFELNVFPGEKLDKKITIKNLSDVALPILVKVSDFTAEENSGEMQFDESMQDPIIASRKWFKIEKLNFILEKGEREEINFTISVPENAEPGGHYSVMLFEPQLPSFYFQSGQPKTVPVIGVLFEFSVNVLSLEPFSIKKPVEIVGFNIPKNEKMNGIGNLFASIGDAIPSAFASGPNIVEKKPSSFDLIIKNSDIYHHKLDGKISIYNSFGKIVGETQVQKITVLPGKTRNFVISVSQPIPENLEWMPASISDFLMRNFSFGKYKAILDLGEEKSALELNQSLTFWALPWKIMMVLFLFLIISLIIRKRIIAAVKILIKS